MRESILTVIKTALPQCAVLLAVYNGMHYMQEQIQTILDQTNVCVTIFASVDLSTDGSDIWIEELAIQEPRIVMLPYGEKFGGASRNFFRLIRDVDFSQFDYIAFADQDDHWYENKLSKAAKLLDASDYDAYSSNVTAFWPDGTQQLINKSQPQRHWDFIFESAGPGCTYVLSCKLMSRIKAHMVEIWDLLQEVSLHDWYCYAFARAKGYRWFIDPEPSMHYRQHTQNQVGVNVGFMAHFNRFKNITNGWWLTQVMLMVRLCDLEHSRFIQSWSQLRRIDLLRLGTHAFQCRRHFQDQMFFLCICLLLSITGKKCQKIL